MQSVRTFDSFDDMLAYMDEQRSIADSRIQQWQESVTYGDRFIQDAGVGVPIFMVVERSPYPEDAPVEAGMFANNRRPIQAWSAMCPRGELGTTHISTIFARVSEPAWLECERVGWPQKIQGGHEGPFVLSYEVDNDIMTPWVRLKSEVHETGAEA